MSYDGVTPDPDRAQQPQTLQHIKCFSSSPAQHERPPAIDLLQGIKGGSCLSQAIQVVGVVFQLTIWVSGSHREGL